MTKDKETNRVREFISWGILGLIILTGISIIIPLVSIPFQLSGMHSSFVFFPFHFGFIGIIFLIFIIFLISRWIFGSCRNRNSFPCHPHNQGNNAHSILKARYAKGEISKEQFEQIMQDIKE